MKTKHYYFVGLTDVYGVEANYSWVKRETVTMPELTHYGYDGGINYVKANKVFERELMKRAKASVGLTGVRGVAAHYGDMMEFRPHRSCTVMFITFIGESDE